MRFSSMAFGPSFLSRLAASSYGRWALERALEYSKIREAFGHPIADYQGVTFPLAESAAELHAAHLMGLNAAALLDKGQQAVKELSMTKAYSVQVGFRAVDRAIQTHGASVLPMNSGCITRGIHCALSTSPTAPMRSLTAPSRSVC